MAHHNGNANGLHAELSQCSVREEANSTRLPILITWRPKTPIQILPQIFAKFSLFIVNLTWYSLELPNKVFWVIFTLFWNFMLHKRMRCKIYISGFKSDELKYLLSVRLSVCNARDVSKHNFLQNYTMALMGQRSRLAVKKNRRKYSRRLIP